MIVTIELSRHLYYQFIIIIIHIVTQLNFIYIKKKYNKSLISLQSTSPNFFPLEILVLIINKEKTAETESYILHNQEYTYF